jgi:coenzyme F420 hydrogenase subunit beta
MENKGKGCKELIDEVVNEGLCTYCGGCSGSCPYMVAYKGRIVLLDNCDVQGGQCYRYCPRTHTDLDALSRMVFGEPYSDKELGTVSRAVMARSTDPQVRKKAQYGGTVTSLLLFALDEGLIHGAVLSKMSPQKIPGAGIARSRKEILDCAGSSYMACPVLDALNRIPGGAEERLGLVATPCQALALTKMRQDPPQNRGEIGNVKLVIGLFCTWAFSQDGFLRFMAEKVDLSQALKFDVPPPPANRFDVYTGSEKRSFPLDQLREFIMPTCALCTDMTAEFVDISVGSVEGIEGWNTVLVRTPVGSKLVERAVSRGVIETQELPAENLAHLKEAALLKKKRALARIIEHTGEVKNLLYLSLPDDVVEGLLG